MQSIMMSIHFGY